LGQTGGRRQQGDTGEKSEAQDAPTVGISERKKFGKIHDKTSDQK
jgi:hypothetical protein